MKNGSLRKALRATDRWMDVQEDFWSEYGVSYRDALKGTLMVLQFSRKQRVYVLRAYDRLERYRSYLRELAYIAKYGPRRPSTLTTRTYFAAQSRVLQNIYGRKNINF